MKKTNSEILKDLYELLDKHIIDIIVRHYKIIKKENLSEDYITLSHTPLEYSNIFYSKPINIKNIYKDTPLNINGTYELISTVQNQISESENYANITYKNDFINDSFTEEELLELNNVIDNFVNENHYYLRLYPYDDEEYNYSQWKELLIQRYMNLYNKEYFSNIDAEKIKNNIRKSNMPSFSDLIAYSEQKYNELKKTENLEYEQ